MSPDEQRAVTGGAHVHDQVSRRVARSEPQRDRLADPIPLAHQFRAARVEQRLHAVLENVGVHERARCGWAGAPAVRIPVVALDRGEQVASVRKRRHPAARVQLRIPADVVDVQMRADDDVDVLRCEARSRHSRQERRVETAEDRDAGPLLGVAGARVVQDLEAVDLEDPALQERIDAVCILAVVLRRQSRREAAKRRLVVADEEHRGWQEIPLPLLDVMHPHVADAQHRGRSPPAVRS